MEVQASNGCRVSNYTRVSVAVDGEHFDYFDISCHSDSSESFTTSSGTDCTIRSEGCSMTGSHADVIVKCDDGDQGSDSFPCR